MLNMKKDQRINHVKESISNLYNGFAKVYGIKRDLWIKFNSKMFYAPKLNDKCFAWFDVNFYIEYYMLREYYVKHEKRL